jgi:hypothetical protein
MTREPGIIALIKRGVRVLTANGDDLTDDSDPSRKMMRQIAGAFAEYEKARLVAKLRAARERKCQENGRKVEGAKSHMELRPEVVAQARELPTSRKRPPSLLAISAELARQGHFSAHGKPFSRNRSPTCLAHQTARRSAARSQQCCRDKIDQPTTTVDRGHLKLSKPVLVR